MSNAAETVFITGATAGIGRHAALYLAERGYHVIASGRNEAALAELRRSAGAGKLDTVRMDVTSQASISEAAVQVGKLTGGRGIDVLINNAGYGLAAPLAEVTNQDFRAQFETNVFGLMNVTRAFLPAMQARRSGRIINVSSIGGRVTFPMFGAYHASKYAVEALSDALRLELRPFGIKVVLIEPGPIASEFANRSMAEISKYRSASSPFAPVYQRADKIKELSDKQAADPRVVSRAMEKAITRRSPPARYVVPFSSRILVWLLQRLPTRWFDGVARRFVGLTRKNLALTAREPAEKPAPARAA